MILLAKKASSNAANSSRTRPCLFDLELGSNTVLTVSSLEKYLNDVLSCTFDSSLALSLSLSVPNVSMLHIIAKSLAMKNGGFPRLAPESLVISMST